MKKTRLVFVISSCIYVAGKPLSYSSTRSLYTPKERLKQTYKTIDSIKLRCPNARIILLEVGGKGKLLNELKTKVNEYLYLGNNFLVGLVVNSKWKGLGEAITLILANKYIINKGDFYIKISGRYYLNDSFTLSSWNLEKFNFLHKDQVYSTRLYGFPNNLNSRWQKTLIKSVPFLLTNLSIEHLLKKFINTDITHYLKKLGVSGHVATSGDLINE